MKKLSGRRIFPFFFSVLLILSVFSCCTTAHAEKLTFTEWKDRLLSVQSFKFNRNKGLGLGDVPVYTAPSADSLRLANGHAACDTNMEFYEAGYTADGWLLIRYDPGNGTIRVGYIAPKYGRASGFQSIMSVKGFDSLSAIAADTISVTDNPLGSSSSFTELAEGDSFTVLAKYTYHGNWWYIECTVQGKKARGFIDRDASSFYPGGDVEEDINRAPVDMDTIGTPSISPLGTEQSGEIIIKGNQGDERKKVRKDADPNTKQMTVVYPTKHYPCYGSKIGTTGKIWYYIFVEPDSAWGWVSSDFCTLVN